MNSTEKIKTWEDNDNLYHIYRAMVGLERKKASIYSSLWTILITGVGGLVSLALFGSEEGSNKYILPMIPPLICVWSAFAIFNYFYLLTLRTYIREIESNLNIPICWYSDLFSKTISKYAMSLLISAISFIGVGLIAYTIKYVDVSVFTEIHWIYWVALACIIVGILLYTPYMKTKIYLVLEQKIPGSTD